jgi:hypothetical protein
LLLTNQPSLRYLSSLPPTLAKMSDNNLGKLFSDIPKLNGKEIFVEWDQRRKLTLLIVEGSQFILSPTPLSLAGLSVMVRLLA